MMQRCACPKGEWRARNGHCYVCGLPLLDAPNAHTEAAEALTAHILSQKLAWETSEECIKRWIGQFTPSGFKKLPEKE